MTTPVNPPEFDPGNSDPDKWAGEDAPEFDATIEAMANRGWGAPDEDDEPEDGDEDDTDDVPDNTAATEQYTGRRRAAGEDEVTA